MTSLDSTQGRLTRSATAGKGNPVVSLSPRTVSTDSTCRDPAIDLPSLGEVRLSENVREKNDGNEKGENKTNDPELATSKMKEGKKLLEPEKKKELLSQRTSERVTLNENKGGKEKKGVKKTPTLKSKTLSESVKSLSIRGKETPAIKAKRLDTFMKHAKTPWEYDVRPSK